MKKDGNYLLPSYSLFSLKHSMEYSAFDPPRFYRRWWTTRRFLRVTCQKIKKSNDRVCNKKRLEMLLFTPLYTSTSSSNQSSDLILWTWDPANQFVSLPRVNVLLFNLVSDQCAQQDPPIGNVDKLIRLACEKYEYGKISLLKFKKLFLVGLSALLTVFVFSFNWR